MGGVLHQLPQADQRGSARFPSVTRRIREDAFAKAEAEAALRLGKTIDQWDELDDYQRAHALGPALVEAEQAAGRCHACGGPASECQDADNQHAYVVKFRRCYRTQAIQEAQEKRLGKDGKGDMKGILTVVTLDPTRKKSATKRGAPRG